MWLAWDIAAVVGAILAGLTIASINASPRWITIGRQFTREASLVFGLYALWQLAGRLSVSKITNAHHRGLQIWDVERWLPLPSELRVQHWTLPHSWLMQICNLYYASMHATGLIIFLIWMFVWHRDRYPIWRNTIALLTGASLLIQLVPVAPPRMFTELGFVDAAAKFNQSVYGTVGTGISDQLSAMPSVHVGWAVLIAWAVMTTTRSPWRWLAVAHATITIYAVVATANHWWLDGIAEVVIMVVIVRMLRAIDSFRRSDDADSSARRDGVVKVQ